MSTLLPFHKEILERIHDPATSDLLVIARGLGLRRVICTLLKIYDSPQNLVLIVNASQEEESEIGEELGLMGCRRPGLRVVGYETGSKDRQELYKGGGIISVTSRILVVDMLQGDVPVNLITGIMVLHAEKVTPLVLEAFIVRLYREKNTSGFLKAFTDQPEHITSGMSPLRNIMKELQLRRVHIYPRFHEEIKRSLERRRADVVELAQPLTEPMQEIHHAIIQCMTTTLSELKRSNTTLDLDDFNVENAYFRSFDIIVRRQLDAVWHKVGPKTKQLVNDLGTLRQLLYYLLTYDPLHFHAYLETLIESNSVSASGGPKQHPSPWLLTDAANTIFQVAKRRCYIMTANKKVVPPPAAIDLIDDEDVWEALDELEAQSAREATSVVGGSIDKGKGKEKTKVYIRPAWLPDGMEPVLEELPKWNLLSDILQEIEEEMIRWESMRKPASPGSNIVLVMASSTLMCSDISEFLSKIDHDAPRGAKGRGMMMRKLRSYLWWKGNLDKMRKEGPKTGPAASSSSTAGDRSSSHGRAGGSEDISEALKKKDREIAKRSASRRRVRGGAPAAASESHTPSSSNSRPEATAVVGEVRNEADAFAEFRASQNLEESMALAPDVGDDLTLLDFGSGALASDFDTYYGLIPPEETVLVRAYSEDADDRMLAEIQPRFIVMFEPNMEFIRRIEVYRSANPGLGVRVYHMVYRDSCEEHKYLAAIRKEKESFERLIKERGSMLMPIYEERRDDAGRSDALIKTISTRLAGGRRELNQEPSRVIVDMREFRSALPSLLHASNLLIVPATLTVGDYILTPDICVERKSLADLVSSFNSGRLYTQCELMSVHYKTPVLLIEFEEDKAFTLDIISDMKSYTKPTGKYPSKRKAANSYEAELAPSIQSKIALLVLSFPRVRIIWSSSPYVTADVFNDLKKNNPEPSLAQAVAVGADDDPDAGAGVNAAAEELLRCLPGVTAKNVKHVMSRISTVREFCEMELVQVQDVLGVEPGKSCWEFMHKGDRKS